MKTKNNQLFDFINDIFGALIFLTRIPLPWINISDDSTNISRAFWAFPIIGLIFGLLSGLVMIFLNLIGFPKIISTIFGIFSLILVSGAIHEHAFVNFVEGIIKGNSPDEKIQIMRENEMSILGILGIIFLILLKFSALISLFNNNIWFAVSGICGAALIGRSMIVFLKFVSEKDSEEDISVFDDKTEITILSIAMGLTIISLIIIAPFWIAIFGFIMCLIFSFIVKIVFEKVLGSITGNVLGANVLFCELIFLIFYTVLYGVN